MGIKIPITLQADPRDEHNPIDVPEHLQKIREMRQRLWDRLEASGGMSLPLRRGNWQANERKQP